MNTVFDLFSLKGKVALITGSASGIGHEIAVALAEAGANVAGTYNSTAPCQTQERIHLAGQEFLAVKCDLLSRDVAKNVIFEVVNHFGRLDILVNCAGITGMSGVSNFDYEIYEHAMNVNLHSLMMLCIEAGRFFKSQGQGGKIINISSIAGILATGPNSIPYVTSKHAVVGVTKSLAVDLAPYGVCVNAIAPGVVKTKMTSINKEIDDHIELMLQGRVPLKRWGRPYEFKGVALLLASEAGSFITGQTYVVDGGYTAT